MKKIIFAISFATSFIGGYAQDIILEVSGNRTEAKVLTVDDDKIHYKKYSNPDGPTYTKAIEKIASITYQNGDVDVFSEHTVNDKSKEQVEKTKIVLPNPWGDTSLPELDYDNYEGFLLEKGNVVYIPDPYETYEVEAVNYLREKIAENGFWKLAARPEQAHFFIVYEVDTSWFDHIKKEFFRRREPFSKKDIKYSADMIESTPLADFFHKYGRFMTNENSSKNLEIAQDLYKNILEIQAKIDKRKKNNGWYSYFVKK